MWVPPPPASPAAPSPTSPHLSCLPACRVRRVHCNLLTWRLSHVQRGATTVSVFSGERPLDRRARQQHDGCGDDDEASTSQQITPRLISSRLGLLQRRERHAGGSVWGGGSSVRGDGGAVPA